MLPLLHGILVYAGYAECRQGLVKMQCLTKNYLIIYGISTTSWTNY